MNQFDVVMATHDSSSESLRSTVPDLAVRRTRTGCEDASWEFPIPHGRLDPVHPVEGQATGTFLSRPGNPRRQPRGESGQDVFDEKVIVCQLVYP